MLNRDIVSCNNSYYAMTSGSLQHKSLSAPTVRVLLLYTLAVLSGCL
jgi:hypothetical protein